MALKIQEVRELEHPTAGFRLSPLGWLTGPLPSVPNPGLSDLGPQEGAGRPAEARPSSEGVWAMASNPREAQTPLPRQQQASFPWGAAQVM